MKNNKWKIPPNILPMAYIVMICIGYVEKSVYYEKFGINIAPYLNFEEYLFFFLPIGATLITFIFFISAYLAGLLGAKFALFGSLDEKIFKSRISPREDYITEKEVPSKSKKTRKFLATILLSILFITPFIGVIYFLITRNSDSRIYILLCCFWAFILLVLYLFQLFKREDVKNTFLVYGFGMALFIPILWQQKVQLAENILSGKSKTEVSFTYNNKQISTNETIKYIGQTKAYIFLRDLNDGGNIIYRKEEVNEIKIVNKTLANDNNK